MPKSSRSIKLQELKDFILCNNKETYRLRDRVLRSLGYRNYGCYLETDAWKEVKRLSTILYGPRCLLCSGRVQAFHHTSYAEEVLNGEEYFKVIPVCNRCHHKIEFHSGDKKRSMIEAREKFIELLQNLGDPISEDEVWCSVCGYKKALLGFSLCRPCSKKVKRSGGSVDTYKKEFPPSVVLKRLAEKKRRRAETRKKMKDVRAELQKVSDGRSREFIKIGNKYGLPESVIRRLYKKMINRVRITNRTNRERSPPPAEKQLPETYERIERYRAKGELGTIIYGQTLNRKEAVCRVAQKYNILEDEVDQLYKQIFERRDKKKKRAEKKARRRALGGNPTCKGVTVTLESKTVPSILVPIAKSARV